MSWTEDAVGLRVLKDRAVRHAPLAVGLALSLLAVLLLSSSVGASPHAASVLLGDRLLESNPDSTIGGQAEAFALRAASSGNARTAVVYLDSSNSSNRIVVALYDDGAGHPGRQLATGARRRTTRGGWNHVSIGQVQLKAGRTYWLALLGTGGTLAYRDRSPGPCRSETTLQHNLFVAPRIWRTGARYSDCPVSAYLTGSVSSTRAKRKHPPPHHHRKRGKPKPKPKPPMSGQPIPTPTPTPSPGPRNWPNASTTGANPATITKHLTPPGKAYNSSATNLTITNTEIDGGVFWSGSGTLTLRNVILRPDWSQNWATIVSQNDGNVVIDHVTIAGVNVGAAGNFTKGFVMDGSGTLDVGYLNESGICQNNLGGGPTKVHDSYIHDIGSGNPATCHTTGIELESPSSGPILIRHNTIDEFPGKDFVDGSDGAIFEQGLYGPIHQVVIDNNYLHSAYWSIEISPNGDYPVSGPVVTNNCLAWPSSQGSGPDAVSDPRHTIKIWSGNTRCDNRGNDTGRPVASN